MNSRHTRTIRARYRTASCAALALALTGLAACGSGGGGIKGGGEADVDRLGATDQAAERMQELYDAAMENGETSLVIYGPMAVTLEDAWDELSTAFPGIEVQAESYSGPELEAKFSAEFSSGNHVADLFVGTTWTYLDKDYFAEYEPVGASEFSEFQYADEGMYGSVAEVFGIEYNTDKVSAEEAPKAWADLADPKWQGRLVSGDVTTPGATVNTLARLLYAKVIDDAWLQGLKDNELAVKSTLELGEQSMARGEYDVVLSSPSAYYHQLSERGAPVGFTFPVEDGNLVIPNFFSLIDGSDNPNAGKLLLEFVHTERFQEIAAEAFLVPLHPDVPGMEGLTIDDIDILDAPDPRAVTELFAPTGEDMKKIFGSP